MECSVHLQWKLANWKQNISHMLPDMHFSQSENIW
jgi:hypothetical protein